MAPVRDPERPRRRTAPVMTGPCVLLLPSVGAQMLHELRAHFAHQALEVHNGIQLKSVKSGGAGV
eukprot:141083-Pleurochrysis_carterae.AAC.1